MDGCKDSQTAQRGHRLLFIFSCCSNVVTGTCYDISCTLMQHLHNINIEIYMEIKCFQLLWSFSLPVVGLQEIKEKWIVLVIATL